MARIYAKNQKEALGKVKRILNKSSKVTGSKFTLKAIGKPNPRLNLGDLKAYEISVKFKRSLKR